MPVREFICYVNFPYHVLFISSEIDYSRRNNYAVQPLAGWLTLYENTKFVANIYSNENCIL